jgi:MFS family permease
LIVAATISGRIVTKTGRYKQMLVAGVAILFVSTLFLGLMGYQTTPLDLIWRMTLLGVGLGPLQGTYGIAIQNAAPADRIGVVTSAHSFFRQIGSTVGVAIFGTLLTNRLNADLSAWSISNGGPPLDLSKLRSLSADAQAHAGVVSIPEPIRKLIADSVTHVFLLSLIVVMLAFIATLMVPELPMRGRPKPSTQDTLSAETHL